jgi:hypothetical protein
MTWRKISGKVDQLNIHVIELHAHLLGLAQAILNASHSIKHTVFQ